jgi:hypothetical protein
MNDLLFVSDAFDILYDLQRIDEDDRGSLTPSKSHSIQTVAKLFDRPPEVIARQLNLGLSDVEGALVPDQIGS